MLGLGSLVLLGACAGPERPENVLLISVDTLRADRLGSYGYGEETSPEIDALARDGVRFDQATSQSPWTTPSHMSLFTSLMPSSHQVNQDWSRFARSRDGRSTYRPLPEGIPTLAPLLAGKGYRTLALTGGGTLAGNLGFDRGFEHYEVLSRRLEPPVWGRLTSWLASEDERPFFLFFHTFEVHAPYTHSAGARGLATPDQVRALERFVAERPDLTEREHRDFLLEQGILRPEVTSALYDEGIRFTDRFLGRLFEEMRRLGIYDETLIVLVSDHGEEFADHRKHKFYNVHCDSMWDELTRVPLILRSSRGLSGGRVVWRQVSLLDVAPTILDHLGFEVPSHMQGRSLIPVVRREDVPRRPAFSEATCVGPEVKSLRSRQLKYVATFELGPDGERTGLTGAPKDELLYDLRKDPLERSNLAADQPDLLTRQRRLLRRQFTRVAVPLVEPGDEVAVGEELENELRALGYVD